MSTYLGALFCERKVTSAKKKITPTDRREQLVSLFDQDFCFWESYLIFTRALVQKMSRNVRLLLYQRYPVKQQIIFLWARLKA